MVKGNQMATSRTASTTSNDETAPSVEPAVPVTDEPTVTHAEATEKQRADVLREYRETGRVREGFAYSRQWPERIRRIVKE